MTERIIIAGSGGQGIMLLGKVLAAAAAGENRFVTWLPSYGAEVRGGTAYCMVTVSDVQIGSPYIDKADTLIIMNNPSLEKFQHRIKKKGLLIINSSLAGLDACKNKSVSKQPFTDLAVRLGNIRVANMLALGFLIAKKGIVDLKSALQAISDIAPPDKKDLIGINKIALEEGARLK